MCEQLQRDHVYAKELGGGKGSRRVQERVIVQCREENSAEKSKRLFSIIVVFLFSNCKATEILSSGREREKKMQNPKMKGMIMKEKRKERMEPILHTDDETETSSGKESFHCVLLQKEIEQTEVVKRLSS